jgi:DNA replication protein DnaC
MRKVGAVISKLTPDQAADWVARYVTINPRPDDDYQPDEATCIRCLGVGLLRLDVPPTDDRFGQTVECACPAGQERVQRAIRRRFGEAQLPPEYRTYPWREHPDHAAVRRAVRWLDDPKVDHDSHHWLLLYGPSGRGKTTLAGGMAAELAERGESVLFRTVPSLLADVRATFGNSEEQEALRKSLRAVRWLFLDDMGTEVPKDWVGEFLYEILGYRHDHHLPTIITSNLATVDEHGHAEMAEYFGPRIWGRVKRMAEPIEMDGPDLRDIPHAH